MAGESAREVARKRRAKAERLNRVADAYERGADGERQTADALAMLPASGWFVLHDVRWPGKRFANIDHVVIGPPGVFVIDSKAWNGVVEVRNGVLRQSGYSREPAVASAADAAMAVAEQVPGLDPYAVQPVLCFVGDHQLEGWARDVMLCTTANLVPMLTSRPQVLDGPAVRRTLLGLQQALKAATSAPPATVRRTPRPSRRAASARHSGAGRTIVRLLGLLVLIGLILFGIQQLPKLGSPLRARDHVGSDPETDCGRAGPAPRHRRKAGARHSSPAAARHGRSCDHRSAGGCVAVPLHRRAVLRGARPDQEPGPETVGVAARDHDARARYVQHPPPERGRDENPGGSRPTGLVASSARPHGAWVCRVRGVPDHAGHRVHSDRWPRGATHRHVDDRSPVTCRSRRSD